MNSNQLYAYNVKELLTATYIIALLFTASW